MTAVLGNEPPEVAAPPQAIDAEKQILGTMLVQSEGAVAIARREGLSESDFYQVANQKFFRAIVAVAAVDPAGVSLATVRDRIGPEDSDELGAVGGHEALAKLEEHGRSLAQLPAAVRLVRKASHARAALKAASAVRDGVHEVGADVGAVIARGAEALADLARGTPGAQDLVGAASAFENLTAATVHVPESLLGDGLICRGDLAVLGGPPGVGKSRLALELVCAIAHGEPWLGWSTGSKPRRVGYVAAEFTSYRFMQRCVQLFDSESPPDDPGQLLEAFHRLDLAGEGGAFVAIPGDRLGQPLDLMSEAGAYALEQLIRDHGLDFIVLDPLARLMGSREETNENFARLIAQLDRIRHRTGCAILLVHHVRKSGTQDRGKTEPLDALRGGTVLRDQTNTLLMAARTHGHLRRIDCPKANYAAEPDPVFYSIPEGGGPTVVEQAPEAVANANRARVLAFVVAQDGRPVTATEVARALPGTKKDTHMDVKTARGHLEVLASKSELEDVEGPKKGTHLYRSPHGTGKHEGIAVPPSSQTQGELGDWKETRTSREWEQLRDEGEGRRGPLKGPLAPPSSPPLGVPVLRVQTEVQAGVGTPTQATEE